MKALLTFLLLVVAVGVSMAQKITVRLWDAITVAQKDGSAIRAMVHFADQVDIIELDKQLTASNATVAERGTIVLTQLQRKAHFTQAGVLRQLRAKTKAEVAGYQSFWIMNAIAVEASPEVIIELSMLSEVAQIDIEEKVEMIEPVEMTSAPALFRNVEPGLRAINADKMWQFGFTGQGVIVMNIDTGVDGLHPSLQSRWRGTHVPAAHAWFDPVVSTTFPTDIYGHGTHTMGTMAGVDSVGQDTIGVAPRAEWIAARVATGGSGWFATNILAAFQWGLDPDGNPTTTDDRPIVVNNSWGFTTAGCASTYSASINALEAAGIAVVFAAGNSGPNSATVLSPQRLNLTDLNVFSVGALSGAIPGTPIAWFSSRGPTPCSNWGNQIKPEVTAPGIYVRSAIPSGRYDYWSGTSMAAPHVCGAIALLKQAFPNKTGTQLKQILYETARDLGTTGEDNTYGMGIIDVYQAYIQNAVPENPRPPRNVTAYSDYATSTSVMLTWTDPTQLVSGDPLLNYVIQIWRDGSLQAIIGPRVQQYTDTGRTDGTRYEYALRATDLSTNRFSLFAADSVWAGGSPYPSPPTDLSCSYFSGRVILQWNDPTTQADGTPLDDLHKILVYRNNGLIDSVSPGVRTYNDRNVLGNQTYRYFLKAIDSESPRHISAAGTEALCFVGQRLDYLVWVGSGAQWLNRASGDSLFAAIAANGKSVFLTDSLFEFGTDLSSYRGIFVVLGIYPYHHFLSASAPEATALDAYLVNGGRLYLEGSVCYNYYNSPLPSPAGYNIQPWFGLSSGTLGLSDVNGVSGYDSLSRFTFRYDGLNSYMDALQPANSRVIWRNRSNGNVCGVFNVNYGSGRSIGVVPSFGGLVDSGMQVSNRTLNGPLGPTTKGDMVTVNTKREVMAAYLSLFGDPPVTVKDLPRPAPLDYKLEQNYPNPFNPTTEIRYQTSEVSHVTLKVFDLLGREVATLVDEVREAGFKSVQWDAAGVASGVYFYRLQAGDFSAMRRMLLIK